MGEPGLDTLSRRDPCPFYVMPRRFELAAAVNRLRTAQRPGGVDVKPRPSSLRFTMEGDRDAAW